MKQDLIEKLLNEQATPEDEHLVAQMLQQEVEMDSWLTEDETAEYDRIVNQRRAKRSFIRWAIAAAIAVLVAVGTFVLWPRKQVIETVAGQSTKEVTEPVVRDVEPTVAITTPSKPVVTPKTAPKSTRQKPKANTTDSLQYYIARLEKELENVNESTYTAKAEEVLRADNRLQRLVQRIMIGELTKEKMSAEALNTNITTEEQP